MSLLTVILNESVTSQTGFAPLTLTLNPSGFSINDGPIVKIEYDFNDGTDPIIVKRKLNTDTLSTSAYAFSGDPGDPRNVIVSHTLFPSISSDPQTFNVSIKVTKSTTFTPVVYNMSVYVSKVDAINGVTQGYFEDIHLIGSRVYSTKDTKFYTFETVNPRYITFLTHQE